MRNLSPYVLKNKDKHFRDFLCLIESSNLVVPLTTLKGNLKMSIRSQGKKSHAFESKQNKSQRTELKFPVKTQL